MAGSSPSLGNAMNDLMDTGVDLLSVEVAGSRVTSSDGTVSVTVRSDPETGEMCSDLSIMDTVSRLKASMIDIDISGDTIIVTKGM